MKKCIALSFLILLIFVSAAFGQSRGSRAHPVSSPLVPDGNGGYTLPGAVAIGGTNPLAVDVDGDGDADFILATSAPAAANSTGTKGQVFFSDDAIYYCIATDTWVKTALATWP